MIIVRQNLLDDVVHQIHHRGQIGEGDLWSIWEALANLPCCGPAPSTSLGMERLLYSFDLPGPQVFEGKIAVCQLVRVGGDKNLNRTRGDWHRDTHADRSRVVTSLKHSARSCCAAIYDSGDFPCRASPHASRITPCPVWVLVGPPSVAPVRRRPAAERSGQRALVFTFEWVSDRPGLPSRHAHLRSGNGAPHVTETTAATIDTVAQPLRPCAAQARAPGLGLGSHAVELCHVSGGGTGAAGDCRVSGNHAPLAP